MNRPLADLDPASFGRIADIAYGAAGIVLDPGKRSMVQSRLTRRLRRLRLPDFVAYLAYLDGDAGPGETRELVSLLTTNVTGFFRESHHFDQMREVMLPPLAERLAKGGRVRLWSAGCSYGNEAYSMAMVCRDAMGGRTGLDLRILATDIDPHVLDAARRGVYAADAIAALPEDARARHLEPGPAPGSWRVRDEVSALVTFRELNLVGDWPVHGPFDIVFCRNVLIYFDDATQAGIFRRFAEVVPPGGWLCLGHSERIAGEVRPHFASRGVTAYQRTPA